MPDFLEPLPDAEQMRATDRWAIEEGGIPALELMERAGLGLARAVEQTAPDGPVLVLCGKGNNGGDGLVAARLLRDGGREVNVVLVGGAPADLRGEAAENLARLPGEPPQAFAAGPLPPATVIVDALLGTGSAGAPSGAVAEAIAALEGVTAPVVSADVPSGVDASTGTVPGPAVRAELTATFHAAKPGLWINPGKAHAGAVRVVDIGIPRRSVVPAAQRVGLIRDGVIAKLPRRAADSTKFASGHVLVAGGSRGLTGAPCLTAQAAARAGAGYVTACVPASLGLVFELRLLEVMSRVMPEEDGALSPAAVEPILELAARGGSLAVGPGLGRSDAAQEFARELVRRAEVALVLDADGLNAHAGRLEDLRARPGPTVLTPHAGELGRLLELDSSAVEAERLAHVRAAAERSGTVVVLKGDDTLVASPGGPVAVSPGATPALATAGTGDVLTGVVAAFLARGVDPFTAACAAVRLHARAGKVAARRQGSVEGVVASDVIDALPQARGDGS